MYFDANMKCLPVGHVFFASVYHPGTRLHHKGVKTWDLLICLKLDHYGFEDHDNI